MSFTPVNQPQENSQKAELAKPLGQADLDALKQKVRPQELGQLAKDIKTGAANALKGTVEFMQTPEGKTVALTGAALFLLATLAEGKTIQLPAVAKPEEPASLSSSQAPDVLAELEAPKSVDKRPLEVKPPSKAAILTCKTAEECRKLMVEGNFIYDPNTGNYINPKIITADRMLNEPLTTVAIGDQEITLKKSLAKKLLRADRKMFVETGEHIKIGEHFRRNAKQFGIYKELKPKKWRVAPPGGSFHEIAQAIDVSNWEKAQKYLRAEGFIGGDIGMPNDRGHFSVGEMGMA